MFDQAKYFDVWMNKVGESDRNKTYKKKKKSQLQTGKRECWLNTRMNSLKKVSVNHVCLFISPVMFGLHLQPDLVPANQTFDEGSSMGTISTSSIFVNVDNQTEERYFLLVSFWNLTETCVCL